jgi:DNA-binding transcriptional LysR family regulator
MNLDLNYLKYFYYVAKENGFTKAAERLHVQQPVVSRAVKLLEKDLGVHLLERQRKNIILTRDGENLYFECQKIFGAITQIQDQFSSKINHDQKLSVACSDSLSFGLIETLFSVFRKTNPNFNFTHQTGSASSFLSDIESGKIDLGIFFNVPPLSRNLVKTKIADIDFHYVVKSNLKNNTEVLNSYIATYSQSHLNPEELPLFKKYFAHNKNAFISFISNSSMTRKACVQKGQGVSILPDFMIRDEIKKGSLVRLYKPEKLSLYLIERQSSYRSSLKNKLVSEIKEIITNPK